MSTSSAGVECNNITGECLVCTCYTHHSLYVYNTVRDNLQSGFVDIPPTRTFILADIPQLTLVQCGPFQ